MTLTMRSGLNGRTCGGEKGGQDEEGQDGHSACEEAKASKLSPCRAAWYEQQWRWRWTIAVHDGPQEAVAASDQGH